MEVTNVLPSHQLKRRAYILYTSVLSVAVSLPSKQLQPLHVHVYKCTKPEHFICIMLYTERNIVSNHSALYKADFTSAITVPHYTECYYISRTQLRYIKFDGFKFTWMRGVQVNVQVIDKAVAKLIRQPYTRKAYFSESAIKFCSSWSLLYVSHMRA